MKSLSLIVPAYNAEKFIENSLREYNKIFSEKFNPFEIIVVCNACKDRTTEKVIALKKELPLKIINTPKAGKGNAIKLGFQKANQDIVGFLDADNPYNLEEVIDMISYLESFDMVIVTKFKRALKYQTSITRRFFSIAGATVFRLLFGFHFKDTQAGAKFMNKTLIDKFKKEFICSGFEFDMELLYEAGKENAKIKEYYIKPNEADFTTVKMRILPGLVYRLLKMRLIK